MTSNVIKVFLIFQISLQFLECRYVSTPEQSVQTCFTRGQRPGVCVDPQLCRHVEEKTLDESDCSETAKVCCPYGNEVENKNAHHVPRWDWADLGDWGDWLKPWPNNSAYKPNRPTIIPLYPTATSPSTQGSPSDKPSPAGPPSPGCGARQNLSPKDEEWTGTPLIVGGNVATPHSWPWMVAVYSSGRFICGGAVIDQRYVLCAAHCVSHGGRITQANQIQLLIGAHDRNKSGKKYQVEKVIVHSGYNEGIMLNDISMFKLAQPLTFNKTVQPICLPPNGQICDDSDKKMAYLAGWGTTSGGGSTSNELREVMVPVMNLTHCQKLYGSSMVTSKNICAGLDAGGKDTCQGDSGGPLVVKPEAKTNQYFQCGIVSWGKGCAQRNNPGVYTKVSEFLDWIAANKAS